MAIVDIAQSVALEVADVVSGPVHVLKDPLGVVGGTQPQVVLVLLVPGLGHVLGLELSRKIVPLQLKAEDGVEAVSYLVRGNALETGLHPVEAQIEGILVHPRKLGQGAHQLGEAVVPIGPAAAHHILIEAGVGLVEASLNAAPQSGINDPLAAAGGVHSVARLVETGEDELMAA